MKFLERGETNIVFGPKCRPLLVNDQYLEVRTGTYLTTGRVTGWYSLIPGVQKAAVQQYSMSRCLYAGTNSNIQPSKLPNSQIFISKPSLRKIKKSYIYFLLTKLDIGRSRHRKHYNIIGITLLHFYVIAQRFSTVKKIIKSISYHFGLIGIIISYYTYRTAPSSLR